jgi:hypothetical protein
VHILTKVFIVFAAVLSLILAALTMAYSVNADAIVGKYNDAMQEANTARAAQQAATAEYSDANALLQRQLAEQQALNADLDARNADLVRENSLLLSQRQAAENRAAAIENQIGDSLQTTKAQAALIDSYRQEVAKLRESELTLRRESLQLEDRVNDLASQNEVFEATIRAQREQLAAAQRSAEMALAGGGAGAASEPYEAAGPIIRGQVTRVSTDPTTGQPLVQLNVGSNDRVAENMQMHVGRGDDFIATLVVVRTDLQSSVARVDLTGPGAQVREGDLVVSRFGR